MKPPFRLFFGLFLNLIYIAIMVWVGYIVLTGKASIIFILLLVLMLLRWPEMLTAYSRSATEDDHFSLELPLKPAINNRVTSEYIREILADEKVMGVIKNDLAKTRQIGFREEWRLGLITPELKVWVNVSPARTAVLHSADYFKRNNVAITHGAVSPPGFSKWSYGLVTKLNRGEFIDIRSIQVEDSPGFIKHKCPSLPGFLQEDGVPLKETYPDGDPLTTDRGGTIVIDGDKLIVIYPSYFVQRRLIDDEGNLVNLGIDEDFSNNLQFKVKMQPSVSQKLFQRVLTKGYIPVVRYRSFPYASDYMLPLLDTPMSASGWADLFIDPRGKANLFISKEKTEDEWYELMDKLKQLLHDELARDDFHLLGLAKDKIRLDRYQAQKQDILADYFVIQEWKMF